MNTSRIKHSSAGLIAGVDNLALDKRHFDPSREDIEEICRFFSLGKLQHYKKEKGITVSHSNFFVHVATSLGEYALKFYPRDTAKTVTTEYAINRILVKAHFPTPVMYAGLGKQPFIASNDLLAACYAYIDGIAAWRTIKKQSTFRPINSAMLSLKNILSATTGRIAFLKQESLPATINGLTKISRLTAPYTHKKTIDTSLLSACRTYQLHQPLFTRQYLHNDTNLSNFLIDKKTVYTLDLAHIREDYILSDLACLVISCLFLDIPATTVKAIIKDYFTQHKIGLKHLAVLDTLVKVGLIKEYLKNIQREKALKHSTYPKDLVRLYISNLAAHKKSTIANLKAFD